MLNIYLTNLGKYNEGELLGEWVALPVNEEELQEAFQRIKISDEPDEYGRYYEEYFITDYETDFGYTVGEYDSIRDLNEIAEQVEVLDDYEIDILGALVAEGLDFNEALESVNDCIVFDGCNTMGDVAERYAEETGLLESMPENLRYYFDFDALGRDMAIEGYFIETSTGFIEVLR